MLRRAKPWNATNIHGCILTHIFCANSGKKLTPNTWVYTWTHCCICWIQLSLFPEFTVESSEIDIVVILSVSVGGYWSICHLDKCVHLISYLPPPVLAVGGKLLNERTVAAVDPVICAAKWRTLHLVLLLEFSKKMGLNSGNLKGLCSMHPCKYMDLE